MVVPLAFKYSLFVFDQEGVYFPYASATSERL